MAPPPVPVPVPTTRPFTLGIQYVASSIWVSIFPVLSTLIAPILLTRLPQGQEILNTVTDDQLFPFQGRWEGPLHNSLLFFALMTWALANWWGSRLLLQRDFMSPTTDDALPDTSFRHHWNRWFPRVLPAVGLAWIAYYILFVRKQWLAGLGAVAVLILYGLFVILRRKFFRVGAVTDRSKLETGDRVALWLALSLSAVLMLTLTGENWWMARFLSSAVILLLGLASLVVTGTVVLTYLPLSYGWPTLAWLPFVLALLLGLTSLNRNHAIAPRLHKSTAPDYKPRPSVLRHFGEWLDQPDHQSGPIVLVAAEGGASRSAWWTAHVLTVLDYATAGEFSKHVYAASGVSGGSLGVATYVALLAERPLAAMPPTRALRFPTQQDCWAMRAARHQFPLPMQSECFLERDFLSTTLGYLLFPDLLQRIVPVRVAAWDRSLGLEQSWQSDWRMLFEGPPAEKEPPHDVYADSLDALYELPGGKLRVDLPLLFLNSTRAQGGRSVLQSPVHIPSTEIDDLFDPRLHTRGLPLSGAVHNSARFPIISPGGEVETWDHKPWDSLVDGGYFENSGAATLAEFVRALKNCAAAPSTPDCPTTVQSWQAVLSRIQVLFIMNDPSATRSILPPGCTGKRPPSDDPLFGFPRPIPEEEILTPLQGLFNTRSARGDSSKRFLLTLLEPCHASEIFLTTTPHIVGTATKTKTRVDEPAMSWYLNPASRTTMWEAIADQQDTLCKVAAAIDPRFESSCPTTLDQFKNVNAP